jgi:hypothetical protein
MPFFCSPDTLIIHSKTVFLNPKYAFEMHISPEGLTKTLCNNALSGLTLTMKITARF